MTGRPRPAKAATVRAVLRLVSRLCSMGPALAWSPAVLVFSFGCGKAVEDPALAVVDGAPILRSEVHAEIAMEVFRRQVDLHILERQELERRIDERLLRRAAAETGTTAEALLGRKAPPRRADRAEVEAYLADRGLGEEDRARVEMYLSERARLEAELSFIRSLREQADIRIDHPPPARPRVAIPLTAGEAAGPENGPVVVIYGSLAEPQTRALADWARAQPKVRWTVRPIPRHGDEVGLRIAQWAVAAEGKGLKPKLLTALLDAPVADPSEVDRIANQLGLTQIAPLGEVARRVEAARRLGAAESPTAFVNGDAVDGSAGPAALEARVAGRASSTRR